MDIFLSIWLMLFSQTVQVHNNTTTAYETVRIAVQREFKGESDLALAIFRAESGLRPDREGDHGSSIGIAQINLPAHSGKVPATDKKAWLKNFQNNLRLAKQIRCSSGWTAWSVFKNGAYKAFYKSDTLPKSSC